MGDAFRVVDGVAVPDVASLSEGFCAVQSPGGYHAFTINVSAERIATVFRRLGREVSEPAFFILETPCNLDVEKRLRKSDEDPFHLEVHHLSWLTAAQALAIYDEFEYVLTNDGYVRFGVGSQDALDEVYVGAYKIFTVLTYAPGKYVDALGELGIPRGESLKTAWDTFTHARPGRKWALQDVVPSVPDVFAALQKRGLYLADHREE